MTTPTSSMRQPPPARSSTGSNGGLLPTPTQGWRTDVLWHCAPLQSTEHCVIEATPEGWTIRGMTVLPLGQAPGRIDYHVSVDHQWLTRRAHIHVEGALTRDVEVTVAEGQWAVDGTRRDDLSGCTDIDLGWTPSTNTPPIRRLARKHARAATLRVAWLQIPTFELRPVTQRYTHLAERRWRYRCGSFAATIDVDEDGLVDSYGSNLWRAIAWG